MACKLLQGYEAFTKRCDAKFIDNSPDLAPEWKSRFFFPRFMSERDSWGVSNRWEEIFPEPVFAPIVRMAVSQQLALMFLWGTILCFGASCRSGVGAFFVGDSGVEKSQGKECPQDKVCSLTKGELVREGRTDLQAAPIEPSYAGMIGPASACPMEGFSVINLEEEGDVSSLREQVALLRSKEVKLLSEYEVTRSEAARLRNELEVSRAEVTRLQASLQEGDVQSLVITEYLCNDIHQRREEFERSHYS
ncbi:hypothetical protein ACLOJK_027075 [Asimina triloba]